MYSIAASGLTVGAAHKCNQPIDLSAPEDVVQAYVEDGRLIRVLEDWAPRGKPRHLQWQGIAVLDLLDRKPGVHFLDTAECTYAMHGEFMECLHVFDDYLQEVVVFPRHFVTGNNVGQRQNARFEVLHGVLGVTVEGDADESKKSQPHGLWVQVRVIPDNHLLFQALQALPAGWR